MAQRNLLIIDHSRPSRLFLRDMADRLFRQKRLILTLFALLNISFALYLLCLPRFIRSLDCDGGSNGLRFTVCIAIPAGCPLTGSDAR